MKAEEILTIILDDLEKGKIGADNAESQLLVYFKNYARIQIEKDRERVKNEVLADEWTCEAINNLPITLD